MYRRINFFGVPNSGKSTVAADMFSEMRKLNLKVELVQEAIKPWAYAGKKVDPWDTLWFYAEQIRRENELLKFVPLVITDSPVMLAAFYAGPESQPSLVDIGRLFDRKYKPLNILLLPDGLPYETKGRYQTATEAAEMLGPLQYFMNTYCNPFVAIQAKDTAGVYNYLASEKVL